VQVSALREAIANRDLLSFEQQLRTMVELEAKHHYFLADEERVVPALIRCLDGVSRSCAAAAKLRWSDVQALASDAQVLASAGALSSLRDHDAVEIRRMIDTNLEAARHYAGTRLPDSDHYGIAPIATAISAEINAPNSNIALVLIKMRDLGEMGRASHSASPTSDSITRTCLLDALLLGTIGTLLQQSDILVRDADVAIQLHLDPEIIKASGGVLIKVRPMLDAALARIFPNQSLAEVISSVADAWSDSPLVMPGAFLLSNLYLLRDRPPPDFHSIVVALESAPTYFADELAIARMNLCAACLASGQIDRYRPLIEKCLEHLRSKEAGSFYSDGVRELQAMYKLAVGDRVNAVSMLEELGATATVYAVKLSALRILEMHYARQRTTTEFIRVQSALKASATQKGFAILEEAMAAAAQRNIMFTWWYFVSLPSRRKFWPFVRAMFAPSIT
jgi:hypothetical protein